MKTKSILSKSLFVSLALASSLFLVSCDKNKDDNNSNAQNYTLAGNASGSQENPPTTTSGTATLSGSYNKSTKKMDYTVTWSNLNSAVVSAQFNGTASGSSAALAINISITATSSGSSSGSATLSDSEESQLLSGNVYFNVKTSSYPNGEVRGQVVATSK